MRKRLRPRWAAILSLVTATLAHATTGWRQETTQDRPTAAGETPDRGRTAAVAPADATGVVVPRRRPTPASAPSAVPTPPSTTADPAVIPVRDAWLVPVTAWCRPRGPISVRVERSGGEEPLTLLLLDSGGVVVSEVSVLPGETNLVGLVPSLQERERTLWLQLVEGDRPIGRPLWITPLRSPPPVRTVRSVRASNRQPYTRVVGWGDRANDPTDPETAQAMASWTPPDPVVTGGFRVEPAMDAILHTTSGDLRVSLAPDVAPATVDNFLRLARCGFYDGTLFHRIVPLDRDGQPFVVQGGDPTGTGDGGPGWNLALEPSSLPHDRGVLGMARGDDPHSAGSQFYIGLSRAGTARLDGQYCTFGTVIDGWSTLDALASSPIGDTATGRPKEPPVLTQVELVPAAPRTRGQPARPSPPPIQVTPASTPPAR